MDYVNKEETMSKCNVAPWCSGVCNKGTRGCTEAHDIRETIEYFEARLAALEKDRSQIVDRIVRLTLQLKEPANAQEDREEEPKDATA